jgi:phosphotransferase system enzyme I (PtsI)
LANIDHPSQTDLCLRYQLSGVGLFRTEFLVLDRGCVPTEDEQYQIYKSTVVNLAGRPLVIRTFDFGADKEPSGLNECLGRNPALGVRGIRRHILRRPDELREQLKAILRAAIDTDISILLPVVTNLADVHWARAHLEEVRMELERSNTPHSCTVKVGAMIETPSAALQADQILGAVDFVSVGTNDLLQYLTASDRDNPAVLAYQQPNNSGLYRLLELVMTTAQSMGRSKDVYVCGELASEPDGAVCLAQIGIRCLSVTPAAASAVRNAIGETKAPA